MSVYTLHIMESDTAGQLLNVPSAYCDQLSMAWDMHGPADLTATLKLPTAAAYALYDRPQTPRVIVSYAGGPIWVGRLEKPRIRAGQVDLMAAGYWRAIDDLAYSGLWSTQDLKRWYLIENGVFASYNPDMYNIGNDTALSYSLKKNAVYTSGATIACFYFTTPAGTSATNIKRFLGTFDAKLPAGWRFDIQWQTAAGDTNPFGASGTPDSLIHSGTGAGVSSTFDFSPAGTITTILLRVYNNSGANYTNTAEDGSYYVRAYNLRVQGGTANAQVRLSDIAGNVATLHPEQLAGAGIMFSTGFDQYEALYEDTRMADVLASLADNEGYQIGIDLQRRMFLWPVGTFAKTWRIEAGDLEIERDLTAVYNANYATYKNGAGRILRTTRTTDSGAVVRWGLTRQGVVQTEYLTSTPASTLAAAELTDTANPPPRTRIPVARVLTEQGQRAPWHVIQPGDYVTIQNLPATAATVDQVRTFQPARVQLDLQRGGQPTLQLESSEPIPAIESLLAQVAGGRILL